jgi:hypothetical protein
LETIEERKQLILKLEDFTTLDQRKLWGKYSINLSEKMKFDLKQSINQEIK